SFKGRVLAILERVAELWSRFFLLLVALPSLDPKRLQTKGDVDAVERDLFQADAHITRAIYKTARRLAGLPRIPCPIENFYRPKLKSPRHIRWLYLNCSYKLQHARRLAIRMAWRWKRETERHARNPLCDLRDDSIKRGNCLPQSQGDWADGLPRRSAAKAGGGSPAGILGARAPPVGCMKRSAMHHASCAGARRAKVHSGLWPACTLRGRAPQPSTRALLLTSEVAGVCASS
ncbi:MAG TPA: hypothetical protein VGO52_26630, partial [Hyphomonadaceae bacterium]|nr:hypothetical protein [Hyphomonadaceae bacterium]